MFNQHALKLESNERGRVSIRHLEPMLKTPADALAIYDKIRSASAHTGWESELTLTKLLELDTLVWKVDDVGIICMVPMTLSAAHVHIFFWDRRLRGREGLCAAFGQWLLHTYGLDTLWTGIPNDALVIRAFARRIGFKLVKHAEVDGRTISLFAATRWSLHDAKRSN